MTLILLVRLPTYGGIFLRMPTRGYQEDCIIIRVVYTTRGEFFNIDDS